MRIASLGVFLLAICSGVRGTSPPTRWSPLECLIVDSDGPLRAWLTLSSGQPILTTHDLAIFFCEHGLRRPLLHLMANFGMAAFDINYSNGAMLCAACSVNDSALACYLLEGGAHANSYHNSPIKSAAAWGNLRLLKVLAGHGADEHATLDEPLCMAVDRDNSAVVAYLLQRGADPNTRGGACITQAVVRGSFEMATLLADAGARLSTNFDTLLSLSVYGNNELLTAYLEGHGLRPTITGCWDRAIVAARTGRVDAIAALLESDVPSCILSRFSLSIAACSGYTEMIIFLLRLLKPSERASNHTGIALLATSNCQASILVALLEDGAALSSVVLHDQLYAKVLEGRVDFITEVIERILLPAGKWATAFQYAAGIGAVPLVARILEEAPEELDLFIYNAFMRAIFCCRPSMVKYLLERCTQPHDGKVLMELTAEMLDAFLTSAISAGSLSIIHLFARLGAHIEKQADAQGLVCRAATFFSADILKWLVSPQGGHIDIELHWQAAVLAAFQANNLEAAQLLLLGSSRRAHRMTPELVGKLFDTIAIQSMSLMLDFLTKDLEKVPVAPEEYYKACFMVACSNGSLSMMVGLSERGVDIAQWATEGIVEAIVPGRHGVTEVISFLVSLGGHLHTDDGGALFKALQDEGNSEALRFILHHSDAAAVEEGVEMINERILRAPLGNALAITLAGMHRHLWSLDIRALFSSVVDHKNDVMTIETIAAYLDEQAIDKRALMSAVLIQISMQIDPDVETVAVLLRHGADATAGDSEAAFNMACLDSLQALVLVLAAGARLEGERLDEALYEAVIRGCSLYMACHLVSMGASAQAVTDAIDEAFLQDRQDLVMAMTDVYLSSGAPVEDVL